MKIAIPSKDNFVDDHFGHCQYYTIFTLKEDNSIDSKAILPSPEGCGCKTNIAAILADMGVTVLLAGNMGEGAVSKLAEAGLFVYRGYTGQVEKVLESYLKGDLGTDIICQSAHNHSNDSHTCSHN
jgi:predicted Fe-Mo cluster-binding NifX family protein